VAQKTQRKKAFKMEFKDINAMLVMYLSALKGDLKSY